MRHLPEPIAPRRQRLHGEPERLRCVVFALRGEGRTEIDEYVAYLTILRGRLHLGIGLILPAGATDLVEGHGELVVAGRLGR